MDDLGVVDPAQVDRGDRQVGMSELALDDQQGHALARHLHRVRVTELMVAPTSAQPPLGRHGRYAERCEKVCARWDVGGGYVGITRLVVVMLLARVSGQGGA
ncbi:MAG TPA: hypothetical protein VGG41_19925, partial [Solirubrobacteraceae bacterium]